MKGTPWLKEPNQRSYILNQGQPEFKGDTRS